ncbi:TPA: hypothetical protein RMM65_002029 [Enterobacter ludwigii]|nr:hypothetical protein [Enterobacter ludwigii]
MKTFTIGWLNKCRCGNKSHTVKTTRGNETALWDDDTVKCNSCGRGGVIQVCEGQARVLWETDEEMAENKSISTITIDPRDAFEKAFPMPKHVIRCGNGYACTEYNAWGAHDFIRQWEGWSAAMLHGSQPVSNRDELPPGIKPAPELDSMIKNAGLPDGNSPVIPDGWVMLPAEPTQAMMNAWLSEVANWRGHAAGYRAMIAAAPQQGVKP